MKRIVIALLLALCFSLSLSQGKALAEDCIKVVSQGAAAGYHKTLYDYNCAIVGWTGGTITNDFTYNCCGKTVTGKLNADDWFRLKKEGKLDGLRFQHFTPTEGNTYIKQTSKVVNGQSQSIDPKDFFK